MTVDFNKGEDSVVVSYVYQNTNVNESVEEVDLYQEAVLKADRYIDLFESYESVENLIHLETEDIIKLAKCKILLEHVDESNISNRFSSFRSDTSENNTNELLKEAVENCFNELSNHPFMKSISNNFDVLYESDTNIDDDIKAVLTKLHRKGYKTLYSCSGHNGTRRKEDMYRDGVYKGKLYTTARVTFDKVHNFSNIPNGWYSSEKDNKTTLYVKPTTYDEKQGSPNEAFAKWKAVYLENLRTWAKTVPEITNDVNESVSDILDRIYEELV